MGNVNPLNALHCGAFAKYVCNACRCKANAAMKLSFVVLKQTRLVSLLLPLARVDLDSIIYGEIYKSCLVWVR